MPDAPEANPPAAAVPQAGEPPKVDWEAKAKQLEADKATSDKALETLKASHASVQRELQKARKGSAQAEALTQDLAVLKTQMSALTSALAGMPDLDDEAKATLQAVRTGSQQVEQRRQQQEQVGYKIAALLQEAGIVDSAGAVDYTDPRAEDIVEAWNEGDAQEALRIARQVKREAKRAPAKAEPKADEKPMPKDADIEKIVSERVAAEVERKLRAAGVRAVDTGNGSKSAEPTLDSLVARDVSKMSLKELKEHHAAIEAAQRRERR